MSIFMDYEGLNGESADINHKRWIDVEHLHWGVSRKITSNTSTRNDRESANAELANLTVTRRMDCATPGLFLESC
ncbi:type VI secretion system tube protein Hcp [Alkalilimnicola sp. S0819]|uniref:type VI secretion system tube protein Hcp n=1 Tax=Alkalilimnicola sp. S0819 TaxID=2613922 RepID=UPI0012626E4F|nr:type VI secretion system tube protein Hcp [Alkalilimnicola sp. S0819]MPQ16397.1 hypothetical protein [Alkalilimnicola sp. S0819]